MPTGLWRYQGRVPAYGRHMIDSRASLKGFCTSRQVGCSPFSVPRAPWRATPNIPDKVVEEPLGSSTQVGCWA